MLRPERPAFCRQTGFEAKGAVAVDAGPRFGPVHIAAPTASVCVLNPFEIEIFLPVITLLGERCGTEAHFHPLHPTIIVLTRGRHVAQVLVAGNGSSTEYSVVNRLGERGGLAGLHSCGDQIAHGMILSVSRPPAVFASAWGCFPPVSGGRLSAIRCMDTPVHVEEGRSVEISIGDGPDR